MGAASAVAFPTPSAGHAEGWRGACIDEGNGAQIDSRNLSIHETSVEVGFPAVD